MNPEQPDQAECHVELVERQLTGHVLKAFYRTYNILGFGFLETVYKKSLAIDLREIGLRVELEVPTTVMYAGQDVGFYKIDLLVEGKLALELKATEHLGPNDKRQLLNFMKAGSIDVGLLLHYGPEPKFHRLVHPKF